ncbi:hypothetical protein KRZ98_09560 [Sphingobium sp. AS12]|uniref:hypothetical protein n=1 Tax=Sphingobium sp. AS12 TaxID=2849495 RepID=UPI001C317ECA|nr:hypothetical protein [Sphingobium sp. AS12]MBV2148532.1 hypothetical protein [Sphingobium sp. AS12]
MNELDHANAVVQRVTTVLDEALAQHPRHLVLAGAVVATVELFRRFGARRVLSNALRTEADRVDRMDHLDTAARQTGSA